MKGYIAFFFDNKDALMEQFPPKYSDVIAHHITHLFPATNKDTLPEPCMGKVVGYVDDGEGLEALVVEVDGKMSRPDDKQYHITWSLDKSKGRKPVQSNAVISSNGFEKVSPIVINLTPKFLPFNN